MRALTAAFRNGQLLAHARRGLAILALGALVYLVMGLARAAGEGRLSEIGGLAPVTIAAALCAYLAGHALRALRLAMLIGGWRVGLRQVFSFQLMTSAVGLTAPLKLGEIYRVLEMSAFAGGLPRAIVMVWWERAFDVAVILLMLAVALPNAAPEMAEAFYGVAAIGAAFIAVTGIVVLLVPENLARLSLLVIRRYDSPRAATVLAAFDLVRRSVLEAPAVVRGKLATIATLSASIWACEIVCFALLTPTLGDFLPSAIGGLLTFLSNLVEGETLLGALAPGGGRVSAYLVGAQAPLAVVGLLAGLYYAWRYLRS